MCFWSVHILRTPRSTNNTQISCETAETRVTAHISKQRQGEERFLMQVQQGQAVKMFAGLSALSLPLCTWLGVTAPHTSWLAACCCPTCCCFNVWADKKSSCVAPSNALAARDLGPYTQASGPETHFRALSGGACAARPQVRGRPHCLLIGWLMCARQSTRCCQSVAQSAPTNVLTVHQPPRQ